MALNFQNSGGSRARRVLLVVFALVSVVLMSVYASEGAGGILHTMQVQAHALMAPFQLVGESGGAFVEDAGVKFSDATADSGVLSELRQQNEELTELVTQAEEYRLEAERLQDLLNLKDAYAIEGVTGRVIGRSTDAWNQTITVDVGTSDGVEVGLTVLGPSGVVGQVTSATAGSCTVRLLTDPASGVAALVQSSRAEGIVRGSLNGLLYLDNVSPDIAVEAGDVVLTSGLGGSFAKGLLIGTVVRVDGRTGDESRKIVVAQNERVTSLEEVIVVLSASEAASGDAAIDVHADASSSGGGEAGKDGGSSDSSSADTQSGGQ